MENILKAIDEVIISIQSSKEYKSCISLKEKMSHNKEIMDMIQNIKTLQKKYIRTSDEEIKKELDVCIEELNKIPIYYEYQNSLKLVNEMIDYVKSSLNEYFYSILNNKGIR